MRRMATSKQLDYINESNKHITFSNGSVILSGIPTSDPQVEGALWNDNGVLKISAGE